MAFRSASKRARSSATSVRTAPESRPRSRFCRASSPPRAVVVPSTGWCRGAIASRTSRASAWCSVNAPSCGGTCRWPSRSICCATSIALRRARFARAREELVALLNLEPLLDVPVRQLSLGQRMRCDLAASLLHEPDIVFLDEPTIGLGRGVETRNPRFRAAPERRARRDGAAHDARHGRHRGVVETADRDQSRHAAFGRHGGRAARRGTAPSGG